MFCYVSVGYSSRRNFDHCPEAPDEAVALGAQEIPRRKVHLSHHLHQPRFEPPHCGKGDSEQNSKFKNPENHDVIGRSQTFASARLNFFCGNHGNRFRRLTSYSWAYLWFVQTPILSDLQPLPPHMISPRRADGTSTSYTHRHAWPMSPHSFSKAWSN